MVDRFVTKSLQEVSAPVLWGGNTMLATSLRLEFGGKRQGKSSLQLWSPWRFREGVVLPLRLAGRAPFLDVL